MCAVSAISDYGSRFPDDAWEVDAFREQFKKLLEQAKDFDLKTGQPDCEDPEKLKWWKAVEEVK